MSLRQSKSVPAMPPRRSRPILAARGESNQRQAGEKEICTTLVYQSGSESGMKLDYRFYFGPLAAPAFPFDFFETGIPICSGPHVQVCSHQWDLIFEVTDGGKEEVARAPGIPRRR